MCQAALESDHLRLGEGVETVDSHAQLLVVHGEIIFAQEGSPASDAPRRLVENVRRSRVRERPLKLRVLHFHEEPPVR